ncbi:MAG: XisI protein [Pleurocapsa sp. MO_226.B13]|nr:XisI protein [Pleurocapsa sp. MO_226.B13]
MGTEELATIIKEGLTQKVKLTKSNNTVEAQTVFDSLSHRYSLFHVGWINDHRVFGCVLHIEIKQDKVWIHWDGTEDGFIIYLEEHGVPPSQIVQGWLPPEMRQHTPYAIN